MKNIAILSKLNTLSKVRKAQLLTVLTGAAAKLDRAIKVIKAEFVKDFVDAKKKSPNLDRIVVGDDDNRWQVKGRRGVTHTLTTNDVIKLLEFTEIVSVGKDKSKPITVNVTMDSDWLIAMQSGVQCGDLSKVKAILKNKAEVQADKTIEVRKIK